MLQKIGNKILLLDGGMGSEIEKRGLSDENPMELNITHPDVIKEIHLSYKYSDFITVNSFGLNKIRYKGNYDIKDLAYAAINNAKVTGKKILFDIGPTGSMLKPLGLLTFDEAYEAFSEIVNIVKDKVDGFILETFSDLYELKAAVLAVKENCDKMIFASMTYDENKRTLTGTSPEIMVNTLEGLGVTALGCNCGLGPKELKEVIERILKCAHIPVFIQPNGGLPKLKDGKAYYDMTAEEYFDEIKEFVPLGLSMIGGCCGTSPEFIEKLNVFKDKDVIKTNNPYYTIVNSATKLVKVNGVLCCGERLNPTGKKTLKEKIANAEYDYLINESIRETEAGADILDLNVGVPKIDEVKALKEALIAIQEYNDTPLQLDSSNAKAIEVGARYYNGIPLINSVNGEKERMDEIFPIVKKYGANVVALTLDDKGVPQTAEERFEIAKRIINYAWEKYGIRKERIIVDTLVLTASSEQKLVAETLKALELVKTLGVKTTLGVSNVSFGLPSRSLLNKAFLSMAIFAGLNLPIMNPLDNEMMAMVRSGNVLLNNDLNAEKYIDKYKDVQVISPTVEKKELTLYDATVKGLKNEMESLTLKELETKAPLDIINDILIKALKDVGDMYEKGKMYLPQLISSAEASKIAFATISKKFPKKDGESKGDIVICTVKGDVHDIGKNICKVVLESYGYNVIDLGKNTPIEDVVEAYNKYHPLVIGLSALMTTTVISMEDTIKALREVNCTSKIFVGGAVLTEEIAKNIGADYYSKDALELVNMIENLKR